MIGIFDSGVGGLAILKSLRKALPLVDLCYFSDHLNFPYGEKTDFEVKKFSHQITSFLIEKGCNLIVVACNTATISSIKHLRSYYKIPFIGVVPAVKPASIISHSKTAVLLTRLSAKGKAYSNLLTKWNKDNTIHTFQMPGFVSIVENNLLEETSTTEYLHSVFSNLQKNKYKTIVLGCTHFLFLVPFIEKNYPGVFTILDPINGVVKQTKKVYRSLEIPEELNPKISFFTSSDKKILESYTSKWFDIKMPEIQEISFEEYS
ncbi:MAG: glutamate racemase [Caldisericia bacterium]|nr:glutamate racemase [Caldisericia bacterium]